MGGVPVSGYVPLRGRVLLEKDRYEAGKDGLSPGGIIIPASHYNARDNDGPQVHRGKVIAMGPPARTRKGHEVAPGFRVGDTVLFVYALATEDFRTVYFPQIHDGVMVVVAQEEVQAVVGSDHGTTEYRAATGERAHYDPMAEPEEPACP